MKNFKLSGCALLFILFFISWPAFSQETPDKQDPPEAPLLVIKEREYDFGEVMEGTRVTHEFIVENQGSATLEIRKVQPG